MASLSPHCSVMSPRSWPGFRSRPWISPSFRPNWPRRGTASRAWMPSTSPPSNRPPSSSARGGPAMEHFGPHRPFHCRGGRRDRTAGPLPRGTHPGLLGSHPPAGRAIRRLHDRPGSPGAGHSDGGRAGDRPGPPPRPAARGPHRPQGSYPDQGIRTTCGSIVLRTGFPDADAAVVRCLAEAGAVLLGSSSSTSSPSAPPA